MLVVVECIPFVIDVMRAGTDTTADGRGPPMQFPFHISM